MTQICYGVFQCLLYHYFQPNETLGYNKLQNSENFSLFLFNIFWHEDVILQITISSLLY